MELPARAEVELDIFSGMPNPTWVLTTVEAETLARRLTALPPGSPSELSGRLGYRGLIVHVTNGAESMVIRVQAGTVHIESGGTTSHARDEGRELERWLVEKGEPHLPANVVEIVERELE